MQRSHISLINMMRDDFQYSGAPDRALGKLDLLRADASKRAASWFNVPSQFQHATQRALRAQQEVFSTLPSQSIWTNEGSSSDVAARMRASAALCARAHVLP